MGDLDLDTAVIGADGRYTATLSADWEIWGPNGGYVAAVALRAAGCESRFARPASFSCQFLGVAAFDQVEVEVETIRSARSAEAFRVSMSQGDRAILEAQVWAVDEIEGLEHDESALPDVARPGALEPLERLLPDDEPLFKFWENMEARPVHFADDWPPPGPMSPLFQEWFRFRPRACFDDPWVDAARLVIAIDILSWPAASRPHMWRQPQEFYAPSLDVHVVFHRLCATDEWLLGDGYAPVAADGLMGFDGRVWNERGQLVASGGGQLLCRPIPEHLRR
jgi:acyl-CoA thioesterase II